MYGAEGMLKTLDGTVAEQRIQQQAHDRAIVAQGLTLATHSEILKAHSEAIGGLSANMNKVMWSLVGFAFTVAGSAVVTAVT